jgi:group I intron endonuclease
MKMGIYKIINVVNNKFYVGSSVNFSLRKAKHFSELRHNKHNNRWLQASWNKHGEKAFVFAVVEEVQDRALLLEVENRWLKEHVGKDYCYNIGVDATAPMLGVSGKDSPTWGRKRTPEELAAQNWSGKKHSPESKEKIRQHFLGKPRSTSTRAKISATLSGQGNFWYGKKRSDHGSKVSKPIKVFKSDGTTVTYESILALRLDLGLKPPTVNRALKSGKVLTRGPFVGWRFEYA